ncbi:hypothetical protein ACQP2U_18560 [Nocardia sp. CA-084685]|uniref:hypothetical protein n=1 Tax=Nocardia sp. CA-084685 TaxID=3239970 RepID=UPI003D96626A
MHHTSRTRLAVATTAIAIAVLAGENTITATNASAESPLSPAATATAAIPDQVAPQTAVDTRVAAALDAPDTGIDLRPQPDIAVVPDQPQSAVATATDIDGQTDINNALSQAGNEFMLAATVGTMVGGVVGLVGGCAVGAVVGAIGGCIPGLALGAAVGPILGAVIFGVPAAIVALAQAYSTLHAAGEISTPLPTH